VILTFKLYQERVNDDDDNNNNNTHFSIRS